MKQYEDLVITVEKYLVITVMLMLSGRRPAVNKERESITKTKTKLICMPKFVY